MKSILGSIDAGTCPTRFKVADVFQRPGQNVLVQLPECVFELRLSFTQRFQRGFVFSTLAFGSKRFGTVSHARERRVHSVVVFLGNRVELVVVTASATERQSQERFARGTNHFVQRICSNLCCLHRILISNAVIGTGYEKRTSHRNFRLILSQNVARNVFTYELIKWLVLVERLNHIVAKRPELVDEEVLLKSVALAEPYDIQPMSPPSLAVVWRSQKTVKKSFVGLWIFVGNKVGDFFGRWRKPQQVVSCPPNKRATIRRRIHCQT